MWKIEDSEENRIKKKEVQDKKESGQMQWNKGRELQYVSTVLSISKRWEKN